MASQREREIESLIGDIETRKFLYEEDLATQVDPEQLAEDAKVLRELEAQLRAMLGNNTPSDSGDGTAQGDATEQSRSNNTPGLPSSNPSAYVSAGSSVANSPLRASASNGPGSSTHQNGAILNQDWRGDLLAATAGSYTPSNAPSPFVNQPNRNQDALSPLVSDHSRKRPRQNSTISPVSAPPKRQALVDQYETRMEELSEELDERLTKIREDYERKKNDIEDLEFRAMVAETSVAEVLEGLQQDMEEEEEIVRRDINLERDGAMARKLQAEDLTFDEPESYQPAPAAQNGFARWNDLPYRGPDSQQFSTTGFRPASMLSPGYNNNYPSGTSGGLRGPQPIYAPPPTNQFEEDLLEISRDSFNSQLGPHVRFSQGVRYAQQPPNSTGHRQLPWMTSDGNDGISLSNANMNMEDDEIERYEEQNFPQDIENLITGIKDIRDATNSHKDETPSSLKIILMKHQKIGLSWMKAKEASIQKGGVLADDMGLGKTIQAIALLAARPPTDPERHPCLIVAPKALMEQWRLEIMRHVRPGKDSLSVYIYHSNNRPSAWRDLSCYDVIITTFGTLTANHKNLVKAQELEDAGKDADLVNASRKKAVLFTPKSKFHRIIIDEAQNIKNPRAKGSLACRAVNATYRWCLTGTPMMNSLDDFQSLLSFLRIKPYSNQQKFKRDFPVKGGTVDPKIMQQLRVLIKSVCLRRTKSSKLDGLPILQLPPKVTEKVHVVFNEFEKQTYSELSTNTQEKISRHLSNGTLGRNYSMVLVLLLRLRQACCHPQLLQNINTEMSTTSGLDPIANAKLLEPAVVARLKELHEAPKDDELDDSGICPVCMDSSGNAVIYIPCGHSVCPECFARLSDPAILARDDTSGLVKCQNCRGPVDPLKITDLESFKKVHESGSPTEDSMGEKEKEESDEDTESEDESEDDDYSDTDSTTKKSKKSKKKSLAELRQLAQKNQKEKRKYLRRLEKTWIPSSKIEKSLEILQENEDRGKGEKTIIFSQFTSLLDLLEVPLRRRGFKYVRFDGSMKVDDRNASVAAFTDDPSVRLMIVSLKAGNAGLNLVAASHVIIFDPFWNPYVEDQAIDRAHRIGQTKEVFVHRLLIEDTVEDRIIELQERKRELISGALDEGGTMNVSRLSLSDLTYLFGIPSRGDLA